MKLPLHSSFEVLRSETFKLAWAALITLAACLPAALAAQEVNLQVVSTDSTADMLLGTRENPQSYGAGTARVAGYVDINLSDITKSSFNLTVVPANRSAKDPAGSKTNSGSDQPAIIFRSESATLLSNGSLQVAGKLTIVEASREAHIDIGESYSGPTFGPPMISIASVPAAFTFAAPVVRSRPSQASPENSDGPTLVEASAQSESSETVFLTGAATVNGEVFPVLEHSIATTAWPVVINNQDCSQPTSTGEDFSGSVCTGTIVASVAPQAEPMQSGEDYAGVRFVPPAGNQVTIALHLALAEAAATISSGGSRAGSAGLSGHSAVHTVNRLR